MFKISSNTLVRNGMPFIGNVLRQVAPYMDNMVITLSKKSDDGTREEINKFVDEVGNHKVIILEEEVESPGQLTEERNKQLLYSTGDWILFLDDDDYWYPEQLELCLNEIDKNEEVLAYSVIPFQLVDFKHYDSSWERKSFSKFLKKEGLRYIRDFPRDLPADKDNNPLYWKTHSKVKKLPYRFFHLSYLKNWTFRNEKWAKRDFGFKFGNVVALNEPFKL